MTHNRILPQRLAPPYLHDPAVEKAIRGLLPRAIESWRRGALPEAREAVKLGVSRLEGRGDAIHLHEGVQGVCPDAEMTLHEIAHLHHVSPPFSQPCIAPHNRNK